MPRRQQRALSSTTAPSEPVETCQTAPAAPAPACSANRHARLRRALSSSAGRMQRATQAVGHRLKPGVQHIRSWQVVPAQVRCCCSCTRLCNDWLTCALCLGHGLAFRPQIAYPQLTKGSVVAACLATCTDHLSCDPASPMLLTPLPGVAHVHSRTGGANHSRAAVSRRQQPGCSPCGGAAAVGKAGASGGVVS
jgi:hypothetical protein